MTLLNQSDNRKQFTGEGLAGTYRHEPVENDWHVGEIAVYRREKSLPFDSKRLCRDLADGRVLEIRDNKGPGKPVEFALTDWQLGQRTHRKIKCKECPVVVFETGYHS